MDELKPCPFCGGEACTQYHFLEGTYTATCRDCSAQMPYVGFTEREAIVAWNTRTPDPEALIAIARAMQERCARVCRRYVTPYGRAGSAPDACEGAVHQVGATILSIDPEALVREYMEKK